MAVNSPSNSSSQQKSSSFQFEKYQFDPKIAEAVGCPNKAFIIEFILWSVEHKEALDAESKKDIYHLYHNDRWYMYDTYDTYDTWKERIPWLGFKQEYFQLSKTLLCTCVWIYSMLLENIKAPSFGATGPKHYTLEPIRSSHGGK